MSKAKQKILVYGISGMVGSRIRELLSQDFKIIAPPHSHLDVTDRKKVHRHMKDVLPDQIVYTAGLTKVDQAQLHKKQAFLLNSHAVSFICEKAAQLNIPVHYISTDAVFDGRKSKSPYTEKDVPNPISIYGQSKREGELHTLNSSQNNSVLRTIMVYSSNYPIKKDFARLAYESLKNHEYFAGITDQIINPTFVDDIVWALATILKKRANGIYHIAAKDYTTNYGFVGKIAKTFRLDQKLIKKAKFKEFFKDKPAPRCQYCWLDTAKFRKKFNNDVLHTINQGLTIFRKQIEDMGTLPVDI